MGNLGQKCEGPFRAILLLCLLAGLAYACYIYLWPTVAGNDKPILQTASTDVTSTPGEGKGTSAGSPAAQQVQGAQAAGELLGIGR